MGTEVGKQKPESPSMIPPNTKPFNDTTQHNHKYGIPRHTQGEHHTGFDTMASSQNFKLIKSDGELVLPINPTPSHTLPLSWFDKLHKTFVDSFLVYKHGQQPTLVIKQALAKALVPYYPLAGRLVMSEDDVHVACTAEGVWFVEATADGSLDDIMGPMLENSTNSPTDLLLPSHPNPFGMPLMLQVTEFTCGGFVVGFLYYHVMADGTGIAQIMKAIADIAGGLEQPVVEPVWLREHVPTPPLFQGPSPTSHPITTSLEYLIVDVSQDRINELKDKFMDQTSEKCSTFDIVTAGVWRSRVRALTLDPNVEVRVDFQANFRGLLSSSITGDGGFYGNSSVTLWTEAPSGMVTQATIFELVTLIRVAKKSLKEQFFRLVEGGLKDYKTVGYDCTGVTDWRNVGFSEVDYGWGRPIYFAPTLPQLGPGFPPLCILVKPPAPKDGCRIITRCVMKDHFDIFREQMINNFSNYMETVGVEA